MGRIRTFFSRIRERMNLMQAVGLVSAVVLLVLEIIIYVQFVMAQPFEGARIAMLIVLVVAGVFLDVFCMLEIYVVKRIEWKIVMYTLDFLMLLVVCLLTGNTFLAVLFCVVLTQAYINFERFRDDVIVFCSSLVLFSISFVLGVLIQGTGERAIDVFGDILLGLMIIAAHFIVENFLLRFYDTNRKLTKALKEADESREELKEVYEQLSQAAVYEERNKIASDIHDNAGHSMTTVIMQTEAAKKLIDTDPEGAKKAVISANIQAKNALEQMRESVHLLAGRDHADSVRAALEEIIAQTMDGTDIKVRSDLSDIPVSEGEFRLITNAAKEALSNGMRHGGATAFVIDFKREGDDTVLLVSDNGSGFDYEGNEGFGLRRMRLNAEALGGRVEINSESGEGCELRLVLPVKKEDGEQ